MKNAVYCRFLSTLLLLSPVLATAQSDNFDSGTLDPAWKQANFNPALVQLSFPDSGAGKALRIRANPVPDQAPAAAMFYRDEVYTNFYMALDVVDWPGTDKNQAIVLVARGTLSPNPAGTTGIIMNYDASQEGEGATDRRQGQLQINMVTNDPPFTTKTLAVAEVTLEPGRPYRLVFKGVGSHYTAQAYDLHDLTQPIVTIEADDVIQGVQPGGGNVIFENGFTSGVSGFLSFSREGTSGTTDVTIDNYFVAAEDPNLAAGSALAHPVPGTPTVESRTPAERFKNFHNPADGISFTAKMYPTNQAGTPLARLFLNGVDVSSQLVQVVDAATLSLNATLPGSALASNTVYTAQIVVEDSTTAKKSTNTYWFDTFSDAYLASSAVKVIEAEEYNYDAGFFQNDPIPVSGYDTNGLPVNGGGLGYFELIGVNGTDFSAREFPESPWGSEFRSSDGVGISAGIYPEIEDLDHTSDTIIRFSDHVREKYAASNLLEHIVHRTEPGQWMNYTRVFTEGEYVPYLRVASFGATDVELHRVTSDPTLPDQTTTKLGTFKVPNLFTRYNYRYIPLVDDQGAPVTLDLSGTNTLRLQIAGVPGQDNRKLAINYLALVPQAAAPALALHSATSVTGPYAADASASIDAAAGRITIPLSGTAKFFRIQGAVSYRITGAELSGTNNLVLNFAPAN